MEVNKIFHEKLYDIDVVEKVFIIKSGQAGKASI